MLTAIRISDGSKVLGNRIEKDPNESYNCEYCENPVIHHKSEYQIKIGHFKHKSGESFCPNTGETEYHYRTKEDIFKFIESNWKNSLKIIELEKWIADRSIRPDVYIETRKGKKIAIEVQATILPVADIRKRTIKYFKEGVYVLWVLPFEFRRFNYRRWDHYEERTVWDFAPKVRLKEYELFLLWCYYKKFICWDLDHEYSESFIAINFEDHKSADVEFRKDGEDHFFHGKKSKVLKDVTSIRYNVGFEKFYPTYGKSFEHNILKYSIPERYIFDYKPRNFNKR